MPSPEGRAKGYVVRLPHPTDKSPSHQATLSVWGPSLSLSVSVPKPTLSLSCGLGENSFLPEGPNTRSSLFTLVPGRGHTCHPLSMAQSSVFLLYLQRPMRWVLGGQGWNFPDLPLLTLISEPRQGQKGPEAGHLIQTSSRSLLPSLVALQQNPEFQVAGALGDIQTEPSLDQVLQERDEAIAK